MSRSEARIFTSIWQDEDFCSLPPDAQRMYFLLLSQPELSMCGRLTLAENQWAQTAKGMTKAKVRADLTTLATSDPRPFIVIDYATDELLIRSFVRRDHVLASPKLLKPLAASVKVVRSKELRRVLRDELQAAMGGPVHTAAHDVLDDLVKLLSSQVNTLSDRVSDGLSDTLWHRAKEKEKEKEAVVTSAVANGARPRATRLPADFAVTADMVAWARAKCPNVDGRSETEKFTDFWTAKSGKDATKSDWVAAWRYWMRNAQERAPQARQPQQQLEWFNQ